MLNKGAAKFGAKELKYKVCLLYVQIKETLSKLRTHYGFIVFKCLTGKKNWKQLNERKKVNKNLNITRQIT